MNTNTVKTMAFYLKASAVALGIALWAFMPVFIEAIKAQSGVPIVVRTAILASPTGSINPHGDAEWQLYSNGDREIEVEVEDTNFGTGTALNAVVDGNVIGQIFIESDGRGKIKLKTSLGQNVPNTVDGSTVAVMNGSTVVVAGVFGGGGSTPSPTASPSTSPTASPSTSPTTSPTASPSPSTSPTGTPSPSPSASPNNDIVAGLSGPVLNGVVPFGFATYEIHSSRRELEVRLRQINLPIGTTVTFDVNGTQAGAFQIESGGEARLRLRSDQGATVPVVTPGMSAAVKHNGSAILTGTFVAGGATPSPSPSPSPSGTPTGTPSPSPSGTPSMGRSFEAHLNGNSVVPAVFTPATGELKVSLNADETVATIFGEFHNLMSDQTGARIETAIGSVTTILDLGVVGGRNGNFAARTFPVSAIQVQQLRAGLWSAVITSVNNPNGEIRGSFRARGGESDLDGDGNDDLAVFRPATGEWFASNSSGNSGFTFGGSGDQVVSADYDGDGVTDAAVYSNSGGYGLWQIRRSSDGGITYGNFGLADDMPLRGDFDGDGRNDLAVFRPSNGIWYILRSGGAGVRHISWGMAGDVPMPADYDGDGMTDAAVFRPSNSTFYYIRSSDRQIRITGWGIAGDVPVLGDFDGDGKNDITVYRPSNGTWYSLRSSDNTIAITGWGTAGDIPVAGRYDADGRTDIAVFRPSDGNWYILRSSDNTIQIANFGMAGDVPLIAR